MFQDEAGHRAGFCSGKQTKLAVPFLTVLAHASQLGTLKYSGADIDQLTELTENNMNTLQAKYFIMITLLYYIPCYDIVINSIHQIAYNLSKFF